MTRNEQALGVVFGSLVGYAVASLVLALSPRRGKVVRAKAEMQYYALPPVEDLEALPPAEESFQIDPALIQVKTLYEGQAKAVRCCAKQSSNNNAEVAVTVPPGLFITTKKRATASPRSCSIIRALAW